MNYFQHNDAKGRTARCARELNRAERAKAQDFDGTMFMTADELKRVRVDAVVDCLIGEIIDEERREERNAVRQWRASLAKGAI